MSGAGQAAVGGEAKLAKTQAAPTAVQSAAVTAAATAATGASGGTGRKWHGREAGTLLRTA